MIRCIAPLARSPRPRAASSWATRGYEAGARTAEFTGAKVHRIPLRKDFSHDVEAMIKADPNAGRHLHLQSQQPQRNADVAQGTSSTCWPTSRRAPSCCWTKRTSTSLDAEPASDLVAADKELIILRTFSKAYGMAGIRAGIALGRPDLLEKLRPYGSGMLPITGLVAATASMKTKTLVPERRKINKDIREDTFAFLDKKGFTYVPSVSNKFMLEVNRPGMEVGEGAGRGKGLHRPRLACVADPRASQHRDPGRDEQVQNSARQGDGLVSKFRGPGEPAPPHLLASLHVWSSPPVAVPAAACRSGCSLQFPTEFRPRSV